MNRLFKLCTALALVIATYQPANALTRVERFRLGIDYLDDNQAEDASYGRALEWPTSALGFVGLSASSGVEIGDSFLLEEAASQAIDRRTATQLDLAFKLLLTTDAGVGDSLEAQRHPNGGWGDLSATCWSLVALTNTGRDVSPTIAYLANKQAPDGSWGEGVSRITDTALCAYALANAGGLQTSVDLARGFIVKRMEQEFIPYSAETLSHVLLTLSGAPAHLENAEAVKAVKDALIGKMTPDGGILDGPIADHESSYLTALAVYALANGGYEPPQPMIDYLLGTFDETNLGWFKEGLVLRDTVEVVDTLFEIGYLCVQVFRHNLVGPVNEVPKLFCSEYAEPNLKFLLNSHPTNNVEGSSRIDPLVRWFWADFDSQDFVETSRLSPLENYDIVSLVRAIRANQRYRTPSSQLNQFATSYFQDSQLPDGSLQVNPLSGGDALATAMGLYGMALLEGQTWGPASSDIDRAVQALIAMQNSDGSVGEAENPLVDTIWAMLAIELSEREEPQALTLGMQYVASSQLPNGSWNDDVYATALALRAMSRISHNARLIGGQMALGQDVVVVGDVVDVNVPVKNAGVEPIADLPVRLEWYDLTTGEMETATEDIIIPILQPGEITSLTFGLDTVGYADEWLLVATVDPDELLTETNELDNYGYIPIDILPASDLRVKPGSMLFDPEYPLLNESMTIHARVENRGLVQANGFLIRLYDGDPNAGGVLLGVEKFIESLGPQEETFIEAQAVLSEGQHEIFVVVDPTNAVPEDNEENNVYSRSITMEPRYDFKVDLGDIYLSRDVVFFDQDVTVTVYVQNRRGDSASNVRVDFYGSEIGGAPVEERQLIDTRIIADFKGHSAELIEFTLNTSGWGERIYLYVAVDTDNQYQETNEENNEGVSILDVHKPDVAFLGSFPPVGTVTEGNIYYLPTIFVGNIGLGATQWHDIALFKGDPLTGGELIQYLEGGFLPGTLTADAFYPKAKYELSFNTYGMTESFNLYIVLDPFNKIEESDESNNVTFYALTVRQRADLAVGEVRKSDAQPEEGDLVTIEFDVSNESDITGGTKEVTVYQGADAGGLIVGGPFSSNFTARSIRTFSFDVDTEGKTGDWEFTIVADSANALSERSESNNIKTDLLSIRASRPDLTVEKSDISFAPPTGAASGNSLTVKAEIKNLRNAEAENPVVRFESPDGTGGFVPLGPDWTGAAIPAHGSTLAERTFVVTGDVRFDYVRVTVDPDDAIDETDESNNEATARYEVKLPDSFKVLDLTAQVNGNDVTLNWTQPDPSISLYYLYRDGELITSGNEDITSGVTSSASSTYSVYSADRALDGSLSTFWRSGSNAYPVTYQLDMPAIRYPGELWIDWRYYAKDFEVQGFDGISWVTVASVVDNAEMIQTLSLEPLDKFQSLRLYITKGNYGYVAIDEINLSSIAPLTDTTYVDLDLLSGTYEYQVASVDATGYETERSNPAVAQIATFPSPTGLTASVDYNDVNLSWDPHTHPDFAGFELFQGDRIINPSNPLDIANIVDVAASGGTGSLSPYNAFDGNTSTHWRHYSAYPYLEYGFDKPRYVSSVVIDWYASYLPDECWAFVEIDGQWMQVAAVSGPFTDGTVVEFDQPYLTSRIALDFIVSSSRNVGVTEILTYERPLMTNLSAVDTGLEAGDYIYDLYAYSSLGEKSLPASVQATVAPPAAPILTANVSLDDVYLSWNAPAPGIVSYDLTRDGSGLGGLSQDYDKSVGTVSASSEEASYRSAGHAFDGNDSTKWTSETESAPWSWQVLFEKTESIIRVSLTGSTAKQYFLQVLQEGVWVNLLEVEWSTTQFPIHAFQTPVDADGVRIWILQAESTTKVSIGEVYLRTAGPITATSYTNYNLDDGSYEYRVRAQDSAGNWSDYSSPATALIGTLGVPRNLTANVTGTTVNLQWEAPLSGPTPDGYNLYRSGKKINGLPIANTSTTDVPYFTGTFRYEVTAVYGASESGKSNAAYATLEDGARPQAPTYLNYELSSAGILLKWNRTNDPNRRNWRIRRDMNPEPISEYASAYSSQFRYDDDTAYEPGHFTRYYEVTAVGYNGLESAPATLLVQLPNPQAPTNLQVVQDFDRIDVDWTLSNYDYVRNEVLLERDGEILNPYFNSWDGTVTAEASSEYQPTGTTTPHPAEDAVDEDDSTQWMSASEAVSVLSFESARTLMINRLVLDWVSLQTRAMDYQVESLFDGIYTTVATVVGNNETINKLDFPDNLYSDGIRLTITNKAHPDNVVALRDITPRRFYSRIDTFYTRSTFTSTESYVDVDAEEGSRLYRVIAQTEYGARGASADSTNYITDSDLGVYPTDLFFTPTDPTVFDNPTLNVLVKNEGRTNLENISVEVYDGIPNPPTTNPPLLTSQTIPSLFPGESRLIQVAYDPVGQAGIHSFTVWVDPQDQIVETDESNNIATRNLEILDQSRLDVSLVQINADQYPTVSADLKITGEYGESVLGLIEEQFTLLESGKHQSPLDVQFIGTEGLIKPKVDFIIAMDVTSSMRDEIREVKLNLESLMEHLRVRDFDLEFGFIVFGDWIEVLNEGELYTDSAPLLNDLQEYVGFGGGDDEENSLEAIATGLSLMRRPGSTTAILMVTDAPPHENNPTYTDLDKAETIALMNDYGIPVYVVSREDFLDQNGESYWAGPDGLAERTGGEFFDIDDPFNEVADVLGDSIADKLANYRVTYTTDNPVRDGSVRPVDVTVAHRFATGSGQGEYKAPLEFFVYDLLVEDGAVTFDPSIPSPGEQATASATIRNISSVPMQNVKVDFEWTDGLRSYAIGERQTIASISSGASVTVTADFRALPGDQMVRVVVDPDNVIEEADESNNIGQKSIKLPGEAGVDLIASSQSMIFSDNYVTEGQPVEISAVVYNAGPALEEATVQFVFLDASGELESEIGSPVVVEDIPADAGFEATQTVHTTFRLGENRVAILVDPFNQLDELDETNNFAEIVLHVQPSLQQLRVSMDKAEYSVNEIALVTAEVENKGSGDFKGLVRLSLQTLEGYELRKIYPEFIVEGVTSGPFADWAGRVTGDYGPLDAPRPKTHFSTYLDFDALLAQLGVNGAFDPGSVRVAQFDSAGEHIDSHPARFEARLPVIVSSAICGNGVLEEYEGCDDGNQTAGDGCNASCKVEVPCGFQASDTPFIDVSETGIFRLSGDEENATFNLDFPFPFFGETVQSFKLMCNGFLSLMINGGHWSNHNIPNSQLPNGVIAPFWSDLVMEFDPTAAVFSQTFGIAPNRYTVVQWNNAAIWNQGGSHTFEAILYESGKVEFLYETMSGAYGSSGASATVGVENSDGSSGYLYSYNSNLISSNFGLELDLSSCGGTCGNGVIEESEACDDGDADNATTACDDRCSGPVFTGSTGEVFWTVPEGISADETIQFAVYFDTVENGPRTPTSTGEYIDQLVVIGNDGLIRKGGWSQTDPTATFGLTGIEDINPYATEWTDGIALGDFDNDGNWDIVTGELIGSYVHIYYFPGVPGGGFGSKQNLGSVLGDYVGDMAVADFNEDGHQDFFMALYSYRTILGLGRGDGTFDLSNSFNVSYSTDNGGLDAGDADGDGHADLIYGRVNDGRVQIYHGQGDGTFTTDIASDILHDFPTGNWGVTLKDFNGDRVLDLVITDGWSPYEGYFMEGLGGGDFGAPVKRPELSVGDAIRTDAYDMDGDGKLDLIGLSYGDQSTALLWFKGKGDGSFEAPKVLDRLPAGAKYSGIALPSLPIIELNLSSPEKTESSGALFTASLPIGALPDGPYQVYGELWQEDINGNQISESTALLEVLPDLTAIASVSTNKIAYGANDEARVRYGALNDSLNHTFPLLEVALTAYDSSGAEAFSSGFSSENLIPGDREDHVFEFLVGSHSPGRYIVISEVRVGDLLLDTAETFFDILDTGDTGVGLAGRLEAFPYRVQQGSVTLDYTIQNIGNADLVDAVGAIHLYRGDSGQYVEGLEFLVTINQGGQLANAIPYSTTALATGAYFAILAVEKDPDQGGFQTTLDNATFIIEEPASQLPTIEIFEPSDGFLTNALTIPVAGTVNEAVNRVEINGSLASLQGLAFEQTVSLAVEGENTIVAVAYDALDQSATDTVRVILDTIPPEITVDGVDNGAVVSEDISLTVSFYDLRLNTSSIESSFNGEPIAFGNGQILTEEGDYLFKLYADDLAGNESSLTWSFSIDKTPPEISVIDPIDGSCLSAESTDIDGTVSVDTVTLTLNENQLIQLDTPASSAWIYQDHPLVEGENELSFLAIDSAANTSSLYITVTRDTVSPVLAWDGVENGQLTNQDITAQFSAEDDNLVSVEGWLSIDGSESLPFFSGTALSESAQYDLLIIAEDCAENATEESIQFEIDKIPPVLSIISPESGACIASELVNVSGITDLTASSVTVNGISAAISSDATFQTQDVPLPLEGGNTLTAEALDSLGNSAQESIEVIRDTIPPLISISGVSDGVITNQDLLVEVSIQEVNLTAESISLLRDGLPIPFASGQILQGEGNYRLTVSASDCAAAQSQETVAFTIDKTPPQVVIANPAPGSCIGAIQTEVNGSVSSDAVSVSANSVQGSIIGDSFAVVGVPLPLEGENAIAISSFDGAGNVGEASVSVLRDTVPPIVSIQGVSDGSVTNQNVTPTVTANDENLTGLSLTLTLDGDSIPFVSGQSLSEEGAYRLIASAIDCGGNQTTSSSDFTIDKTAPQPYIIEPLEYECVNTPQIDVVGMTDQDTVTVGIGSLLGGIVDGVFTIEGVSMVANSVNELTVFAIDLAGNQGETIGHAIHDDIDPIIWINGAPESGITNQNVTLEITAQDANLTQWMVTVVKDGAYISWSEGTSLSEDGFYQVTATATDCAGNQTSTTTEFEIDKTPPEVSVLEPTDSSCLDADSVQVSGVASLDAVAISVNGVPAELNLPSFTATGIPLEQDQENLLEIEAEDAIGNVGSAYLTLIEDSTPPTVTISGVANGGVYHLTASVEVTAEDANLTGLTVLLDGTPYENGEIVDSLGAHTLSVEATDCAGHLSQSEIVFYVFELTVAKYEIPDPSRGLELLLWTPVDEVCLDEDQDNDVDCGKIECYSNHLDALGVSYTQVFLAQEFVEEMRSGQYGSYILADHFSGEPKWASIDKHQILQELTERVFSGDGLVTFSNTNNLNNDLSEAWGARLKSANPGEPVEITVSESDLFSEGTLILNGKKWARSIKDFDLDKSAVHAVYDDGEPALLSTDHAGSGKSALFPLELCQAQNSEAMQAYAETLLLEALENVTPSVQSGPLPNDSIRIAIDIDVIGADIDLIALETIPSLFTIWEANESGVIIPPNIEWTQLVEDGDRWALEYQISWPDGLTEESYILDTDIQYLVGGEAISWGEISLTLMTPDTVISSAVIIEEIIESVDLEILSLGNQAHFLNMVGHLEDVFDKSDELSALGPDTDPDLKSQKLALIESILEDFSSTVDDLMKIDEIDLTGQRVQIDQLIRIWSLKWSLISG